MYDQEEEQWNRRIDGAVEIIHKKISRDETFAQVPVATLMRLIEYDGNLDWSARIHIYTSGVFHLALRVCN